MSSSMRVADLMRTTLVVSQEGDPVRRAVLQMRSAAIRHLPVVDADFRLVGIVCERDVAPIACAKEAEERAGRRLFDEDATRVGEVMTRSVCAVGPELPADEAAALLIEHRIGALPVVGEGRRLLGIVTSSDFLRYAHEALGEPLLRAEVRAP